MRAIVITSHGGVDGIGLQEVEMPPKPTADRVRVRVHAAGLNRADIMQREGKYPAPPGYPQNIPGLEFAGEVEAVGDAVRTWNIGDRVFGITAGGGQAEFVLVPESNLARIPAELNWTEAAAMPEVFITAHDALFTRAVLQIGERVLVHAAGSGVGTAAVQLAHAAGATVYGTSRTAEKLEQARALGLDESITVGDSQQEFVASVQKLTDGARASTSFSTWSAAPISRPTSKRSPLAGVSSVSGPRPDENLKSISGSSCGSALPSSARCSEPDRRRRKPKPRAGLSPMSCRWFLAASFIRSSTKSTLQQEVRAAHRRLESTSSGRSSSIFPGRGIGDRSVGDFCRARGGAPPGSTPHSNATAGFQSS